MGGVCLPGLVSNRIGAFSGAAYETKAQVQFLESPQPTG